MAIRNILPDSDPALHKVCRAVSQIDERVQEQVQDLIDTLAASGNGIGLAAPQVGLLKRIFVIDMQEGEGPIVFINPEIIEAEGEQYCMEGCLSVPGTYGKVKRPAKIKVKATNLAGQDFEIQANGLFAVCICHENDHLDGIIFTSKVEGKLHREEE